MNAVTKRLLVFTPD